MDRCIPANPDISGIGVRVAIYTQNLLSFAPLAAHLWDGKVSKDEMTGVKDQSIGMLAIAFAILISTIIQALSGRPQSITNFHAAVILELSWMNNTSTFIWFLLYVHHQSGNNTVPATWAGWAQHLLSPRQSLRWTISDRIVKNRNTKEDLAPSKRFIQDLWKLVSRAPVLTLGSIHLSLMACVGIWLWSNPSDFGAPIPCEPALVIVGIIVKFLSPALRIWSLLAYSLLLIPGINLIPGFLFFLSLHILYNKSWRRYPKFWIRFQHAVLRNPDQEFRRPLEHSSDEEAHVGRPTPAPSEHPASDLVIRAETHFTFLVVGLACLAIINVIFLVDIERTLFHNKRIQSRGEDEWGFGQILALLLLVVPLRDFVTSIINIRSRAQATKQDLQERFEQAVRSAIEEHVVGRYFENFIAQGANPNTQLNGSKFVTLLQFAAYKKNQSLVNFLLENEADPNILGGQYGTALQAASAAGDSNIVDLLLEKGADVDFEGGEYGTAFQAASENGYVQIAFLLFDKMSNDAARSSVLRLVDCLKLEDLRVCTSAMDVLSSLAACPEFYEVIRMATRRIGKFLKHSEGPVREAAIEGLSNLATHPELHREIRMATPLKCLKDSDKEVRKAAMKYLSGFAADSELHEEIRMAILGMEQSLKDSDESVREVAIVGLSTLAAHPEFHVEIQKATSSIRQCLTDSEVSVRVTAIEGLSILAAYRFHEEIRPAIPAIVKCLQDSKEYECRGAIMGLSSLAAHPGLHGEVRTATPGIVKCLNDSEVLVRIAAIKGLSNLSAAPELHEEIRMAILGMEQSLEDSDVSVRKAAVKGLSTLAAHSKLDEEIQKATSSLRQCLKDSDESVRVAAVQGFSSFTAHPELHGVIRSAIPRIVEFLKHWYFPLREAAVKGLSILVAHPEFHDDIRKEIPGIVEYLKHSEESVREAAINGLASFSAYSAMHQEIRKGISSIAEFVKDSEGSIRDAAIDALSSLTVHPNFDEEIRLVAIQSLVSLTDSEWKPPGIAAEAELHEEIRTPIPELVEYLTHENSGLNRGATINLLSSLAVYPELHREIRDVIPTIVECLNNSEVPVRKAAIKGLASLAAYSEMREKVRQGISGIVGCLNHEDEGLCEAAIKGISSLATYPELHDEIRIAIPSIVECLKKFSINKAVIDLLARLVVTVDPQRTKRTLIHFCLARITQSEFEVYYPAEECLSRILK